MSGSAAPESEHSEVDIDPELLVRIEPLLSQQDAERPTRQRADALHQLLKDSALIRGPLRALGTHWNPAAIGSRLEILARSREGIDQLRNELDITASLLPETFLLHIPLAEFMAQRAKHMRSTQHRAAVFGINGAQGSGKTTLNTLLQLILNTGLGLSTVGFSLDDVYKSFAERKHMGQSVHPLFAIRSVAGTHDTELAMQTLLRLMHSDDNSITAIPRFDKMAHQGAGDRLPRSQWQQVHGRVDIVIFEGWMVGARPQPEQALEPAVNVRERKDDPDGVWRKTMNDLLATRYQSLFALLDELIVMQVDSMEAVYRNRERQEQHLRKALARAQERGEPDDGRGAMSPAEVIAFIALYERTTRHMLATLPEQAAVTCYIGAHHRIERLRVQTNTQA